ncbi:MAG: cytochrome b/b6 domain-containing protein [Sphingosinicella sp.]
MTSPRFAPRASRSPRPARTATTASARPRKKSTDSPAARVKGRIWDLPTRAFHWLLVVLIGAAWWTADQGMPEWHARIGMGVLMLLLFRLAWGFIGSSTARFTGFVRGPGAVLASLRGRHRRHLGHNPLGALSVIALLALTAAMVGLGLVAIDEDGLFPGPLALLVSEDVSEWATELHEHEMFDLLLVMVALHVAAILYYFLARRQDLLTPMISGHGTVPDGAPPMVPAPEWRAWLAAAIALLASWWVWEGAPLP